MKFGIREICDVVLKAKAAQKIGNKVFYKGEPVLYFDSLKTSSMEGQATTVYAQGGKGNPRLVAWEGERTVTFTMEDALISPEGLSILTGANLIHASEKSIIIHTTEITDKVKRKSQGGNNWIEIEIKNQPYLGKNRIVNDNEQVLEDSSEDFIYIMLLDDNGEVSSEPFIASESNASIIQSDGDWKIRLMEYEDGLYISDNTARINDISKFVDNCSVLVDYYIEKNDNAYQVDITPDSFSGNFYLEASTLFRSTNGIDMPAEFIIPNCKIQSNFTFTMASSGDPSTFTFTMDAFPDYTRWNRNKKVYAAIQVIEQDEITENFERLGTKHNYINREACEPFRTYNKQQAIYLDDEPQEIDNLIFTSIDENGNIYNDGLGYKKGYKITSSSPVVDSLNEYTVSGFIPYEYNQAILITGGAEESAVSQRLCFYDNNFDYIAYTSITQPLVEITNLDSIISNNESLNQIKQTAKYIRVSLKNQNIRDMVVQITGEPYVEPEEEPSEGGTPPTG